MNRDLSAFVGLEKKLAWGERFKVIGEQFPVAVTLDWRKAFANDVELWGRLVKDLLKVDQTVPGRSGPRPVLDRSAAERRLKQFMRVDYSELWFQEAFTVLCGNRSHRHLATKLKMDRNLIQRLLSGKKQPTIQIMEQIAEAFGKDPSYFVEYRMAYILGALSAKMDQAPEMSIDLYNKLRPRKSS